MTSPTLVGLTLHLNGGRGHVLPYHKSLGQAVKINGWQHLALVSHRKDLPSLPEDWKVEYLDSGLLDCERNIVIKEIRRLNIFAFARGFFCLTKDLVRSLRKEISTNPGEKIIFLESFNPLQLLALVITLFFLDRRYLRIWLMYRGGPNWGGKKHRLMARSFSYAFRLMNPIIEILVGKRRLTLLTDSAILSANLPGFYKRSVNLLPIPHTPSKINKNRTNKNINQPILCWWPGAPRPEKGLEHINRLISLNTAPAKHIKFVLPRSIRNSNNKNNSQIQWVDDKLPTEEYEHQLLVSSCILLPYDKDLYSESTSGVFTECVVAGALPLVSRGTWMAYELEKRDLNALCINWDSSDALQRVIDVNYDEVIQSRFIRMRDEYRSFHSIPSFARELEVLWARSVTKA